MKSFIFGASSGVGRALAEELAERGSDLFLVSSASEDLRALASHLELLHKVRVEFMEVNAGSLDSLDRLCLGLKNFGGVDNAFFPIGFSSDVDCGYVSMELASNIVNINFLYIVGCIEEIIRRKILNESSRIIGFGSIASIRGRTNNKIYSAAKSALETYFQSLSHQLSSGHCQIYFFKLGYINTQQTFGKKLKFPPVDSKQVSKYVMRKIKYASDDFYYPTYWALISMIIRSIPKAIFNKINF